MPAPVQVGLVVEGVVVQEGLEVVVAPRRLHAAPVLDRAWLKVDANLRQIVANAVRQGLEVVAPRVGWVDHFAAKRAALAPEDAIRSRAPAHAGQQPARLLWIMR